MHLSPQRPRPTVRACLFLLSSIALVGCGSAGPDAEASSSDLLVDDGGLPHLDGTTAAWWLAPPGCEGMLGARDLSIAIASLEHHLVAAVDGTGEIICVDTVEAVGEELCDLGRGEDASELQMRFEESELGASAAMGERYTGDPHPEPNDTCTNCGDPHPEPN
jgi:hypothetical protein